MLWVRTDNSDNSVSLDNLTLIADRLYTGSYFHKSPPENLPYNIESWQFAMNYNPIYCTKIKH